MNCLPLKVTAGYKESLKLKLVALTGGWNGCVLYLVKGSSKAADLGRH